MSSAPEYPKSGGRWLGNGEAFEVQRQMAARSAEALERIGDEHGAAESRAREELARRRRDDEHRREQDRRFRASVFRRRY